MVADYLFIEQAVAAAQLICGPEICNRIKVIKIFRLENHQFHGRRNSFG